MVGKTVSHYRIVETLGAGGMGVVYKAEDVKLARSVALKFLAPDRTHDKQMVERFVREARTASALNHPGICTIYEIDEHEGLHFIAMELLEGEPLDRRIGGRPLAVTVMIDWSIQIAGALEAAHAQGILHRDIKPANIFVTTRGQVKILDFGLAKLVEPEQRPAVAGIAMTQLETELLTTKQGTALGTIAYMSPEQARGEDLDVRTDLFSFGLVLYEMATGQRTFEGQTSAVVFDAILNREPKAPIELNANIPLTLERIIGRCLQKDRQARYQSAAEIRADLEQVKRERDSGVTATRPVAAAGTAPGSGSWPSAAAPVAAAPRSGPLGRYGSLVMAGLGIVTLGAAIVVLQQSRQPDAQVAATAPAPPVQTTATAAPAPATPSPGVQAADATATPGAPGSTPTPAPAGLGSAVPAASTPLPATAPAAATGVVPAATPPRGGSAAAVAAPATRGATAPPPGRRGAVATGGAAGTAAPGTAAAPPVPAAPAPPPTAVDPGVEAVRVARAKFDARLYDQAYADLQHVVTQYAGNASAADAYLLMGSIRERQNRPEDAMAAYVELRSKHPASAAAAEGTFNNAELLLRSRRDDRDRAAIELYTAVEGSYPNSPFAPRALARRASIEDRVRMRVADAQLGGSVPAALVSYRSLVERYPTAAIAETAYDQLAKQYEDLRRYELAATTLQELATRFPANRVDAAWRAGELFEDRVKDPARARAAYAMVPQGSQRYRDAQRKLQP